jgi:hypothetical protein
MVIIESNSLCIMANVILNVGILPQKYIEKIFILKNHLILMA